MSSSMASSGIDQTVVLGLIQRFSSALSVTLGPPRSAESWVQLFKRLDFFLKEPSVGEGKNVEHGQ
jgi:hypothetical protein